MAENNEAVLDWWTSIGMVSPPDSRDRPHRLVVADDDDMLRFLAVQSLQAAGFETIEAADGEAAVRAVEETSPDLAILDVVMTPLDGFSACRRLRAAPWGKHLPILMMTGLDDASAVEAAYRAGATDFIGKPLNYALLAHRVRYLIRAASGLAALAESQRRMVEAQEMARLGGLVWEPDTARFWLSAQGAALLERCGEQTLSCDDVLAKLPQRDAARVRAHLARATTRERMTEIEFQFVPTDGKPRYLSLRLQPIGQEGAFRGTLQDVTEQHDAADRIHYLAYHDPLTGLPNRTFFREHLDDALLGSAPIGLLLVDFDRFKEVNDTLGHAVGDQLLVRVSGVLRDALRDNDIIARLGGDEFGIIHRATNDPIASTAAVARRIVDAAARAFAIDGVEIRSSVSVGAAAYPNHSIDTDSLLARADIALYRAKDQGRGVACVFEKAMEVSLRARQQMEADLRAAIDADWLNLHYQPQIDLASGAVVGCEALARMIHPSRGLVAPGEFIGIAEETGLISRLGTWALGEACRQAAKWHQAGHHLRVAVNVSVTQFQDPHLVDAVRAALDASGLPGEALELEVTESVLAQDFSRARENLKALSDLGIVIAIDDFGTGYSSLSYLRSLPVHCLKIDRSFVADLGISQDAAKIVETILALAKTLGLKTIAEGVETTAQEAWLRERGCDEAQGFLYLRPRPLAVLEAYLDGRRNGGAAANTPTEPARKALPELTSHC